MKHLTYQDFLRDDMTLEPFGIVPGESKSDYFCTPRGATILGWTGVDGIHYVQIKSLGEIVFAVNPYAEPGRHAHPVAKNFEDFLRLLAKCGHESHLEQIHDWTWEQYEDFCQQNDMTAEQNEAAERIMAHFALSPISDVFTYVKQLDESFDFSTIPYTRDYWEYVPRESVPCESEWRVYFSAAFGERGGKGEKPGTELPLNVQFSWDGRLWRVPAAYLCAKGLVVDLIASATVEEMQAYTQKWESMGELSPSEERAAEAESPLRDDFVPSVQINGQLSRMKRMTTLTMLADGREPSPTDRQVLLHYGLDEHTPTLLCRVAFPWVTSKKPTLRSLRLCMSRRPVMLVGNAFSIGGEGEQISIPHPNSGNVHMLTVMQYQHCRLSQNRAKEFCIPTHGVQLMYSLSPDLPDSEFSLRDVRHNDMPIKQSMCEDREDRVDDFCSVAVVSVPHRSESEAAAIGIIGGADGPTAMAVGHAAAQPALHAASSALTFEVQAEVTWQPVFCVKTCEDIMVQLV